MSSPGAGGAPGWDALTAALRKAYGEQEPYHVAYPTSGPAGLSGASAYRAQDQYGGHWHFVTYGLTELHVKESTVAEWSGWGFELTFRFAGPDGDVPTWPFRLLGQIGRYVWAGNTFAAGDHINLEGPITGTSPDSPDTSLTGLLVVPDMTLDVIGTPHGKVRFLQLVGLTGGEEALLASGEPAGPLVSALSDGNDLLVTDIIRRSRLRDVTDG